VPLPELPLEPVPDPLLDPPLPIPLPPIPPPDPVPPPAPPLPPACAKSGQDDVEPSRKPVSESAKAGNEMSTDAEMNDQMAYFSFIDISFVFGSLYRHDISLCSS